MASKASMTFVGFMALFVAGLIVILLLPGCKTQKLQQLQYRAAMAVVDKDSMLATAKTDTALAWRTILETQTTEGVPGSEVGYEFTELKDGEVVVKDSGRTRLAISRSNGKTKVRCMADSLAAIVRRMRIDSGVMRANFEATLMKSWHRAEKRDTTVVVKEVNKQGGRLGLKGTVLLILLCVLLGYLLRWWQVK